MATTLEQEIERTADGEFRRRVRAAVFRILPDIIGESGASMNAERLRKRHAWAMRVLEQPNDQIDRVVALVVGENQIRAVDIGGTITDALIVNRVTALIDDLAGVLNSETP